MRSLGTQNGVAQCNLGGCTQIVTSMKISNWPLERSHFSHERPKSRTRDKLNWPLERSNFPTYDQSPDSIHSRQRCYGLNLRQTVCNFLQCNMSKRGDHGTAYEPDRWGGGRCSIMEKVFLVTRQRPATSTFCTYCGDWVKCTYAYILHCHHRQIANLRTD